MAGAALDARVRQAVNFIPDSTLVHVARRLAEDARASDVVYVHDGTVETVRVMLRPLLVMPEQLGYLHHVCTRIMSALARFPELYARDADVRRAVPLADDERAWFDEVWPAVAHAETPLYGRLDAVCDFTSARWQDSLKFMEPNLSGVGGIHLGPLAETLVMRDVVPTLSSYDPLLAIDAPRDQRDLFLQVLLDHARAIGSRTRNLVLVEPKYVAEGPDEQSHLVEYYRARRGIELSHADPRELRLVGDDVYYEDVRIDVAYRDYEMRDLLALEQEHGQRLDGDSRAVPAEPHGLRDRRRPRSQELLGGADERGARGALLQHRGAATVPPPRAVDAHRQRAAHGHAGRADGSARVRARLPRGARAEAEPRLRRRGRASWARRCRRGEWETLLEQALAAQHDPHRQWVVQAAATLPVHLFPVLDEQGRTHEEPFYAVMGFAPTDHGLGIIARVSQKQVVNVAQRGGLAAVLVGYRPEDLEELDALARAGRSRDAGAARARAAPSRSRRRHPSARVGRGDLPAARCGRGPRFAARRPRRVAARALGRRPARRPARRARGARGR